MNTIGDLQNLISEYQNFQGSYYAAGDSLNRVVSTGTVLYNDPVFAAQFPNSIAAYKTYLVSLQTAINAFIASLPVAPQING